MTTPLDLEAIGSGGLLPPSTSPSPSMDAAHADQPIAAAARSASAAALSLNGGGSKKQNKKKQKRHAKAEVGSGRSSADADLEEEQEADGECTKSSRLISAASDPPAARLPFSAHSLDRCHGHDQLTTLDFQLMGASESRAEGRALQRLSSPSIRP